MAIAAFCWRRRETWTDVCFVACGWTKIQSMRTSSASLHIRYHAASYTLVRTTPCPVYTVLTVSVNDQIGELQRDCRKAKLEFSTTLISSADPQPHGFACLFLLCMTLLHVMLFDCGVIFFFIFSAMSHEAQVELSCGTACTFGSDTWATALC